MLTGYTDNTPYNRCYLVIQTIHSTTDANWLYRQYTIQQMLSGYTDNTPYNRCYLVIQTIHPTTDANWL